MATTQDDRGMLAKIGFFLCRDGLVPDAEAIFQGLADSDPEKDGPAIGLALCGIIKRKPEEALGLIDAKLAKGSGLAGPLKLYKIVLLGMAGKTSEAKALRDSMRKDGMNAYVDKADRLIADLAELKLEP